MNCGEAWVEGGDVGDGCSQSRDVEERGEINEENSCVDVENDVRTLERATDQLQRRVRNGSA